MTRMPDLRRFAAAWVRGFADYDRREAEYAALCAARHADLWNNMLTAENYQ